eukprot:3173679-Amphidinium_carterae.1
MRRELQHRRHVECRGLWTRPWKLAMESCDASAPRLLVGGGHWRGMDALPAFHENVNKLRQKSHAV